MKRKYLVMTVMAVALSMTVILGGCGKTSEKPAAGNNSNEDSKDKKAIAGIVFQEDQFFKMMSTGYQSAANDLGYELNLSNITNDQTKETEIVNTYTAQGVLGIAISPLSAIISPEALRAASEAGIKIAVANADIANYPFATAAYTSDNFELCRQTGEIAADFIKENYGADETVKIGVLQFKTQIPEISADRVNGFFAALDDAGIKYEIVADQDAWLQDVAIGKAGDIIAANPDIDIIFAANDGGTIGTVMAVENAGRAGEVFVFGTDASEQMVDLLKADTNILQAVTGQDPYSIGYKTVESLVAAIEGKEVTDGGKTNIIAGIPLKRGDTAGLDAFLSDMNTKMK